MQTVRILQAVLVMVVIALLASCATSKEYVGKILKPRDTPEPVLAKKEPRPVRFLEFDSTSEETETWVKTWIEGDSAVVEGNDIKTEPLVIAKTSPAPTSPVIKTPAKTDTIVAEKVTPILPDPVARTGNPDGTRTKKTREDPQ
jgi:hypothetical protein